MIVRRSPARGGQDLSGGMHPLLRRVYAHRGVASTAALNLGLSELHSLSWLGGARAAAALLHRVMASQGRILVLADFDADGATSCALMIRGLRMMGAENLDYLVPDRFRFGYGLTKEILEVALEYRPDLLVTVDNGISSLEGVAAARAAGIQVLITDHHLPGQMLPDADVIVNPNQPGDPFPSKHLAGVGVVFYVLAALRDRLRTQGWFDDRKLAEPNLASLLDLVALGTVADVVPLDRNNRILVHQGLKRIRAGRCCKGIDALVRVSGRRRSILTASDLGFALGPRLNAAGRLETMSLGIECLLTDDAVTAENLAWQLDSLNRERRAIEDEMRQQATVDMEGLLPEGGLPFGICLFRPEWHPGVVGILAARIREYYHRPVIAFAGGETPGLLKGSARSVPGLHIRDTLDSLAARHPKLLRNFGGHAMAAGVSLDRNDFERFTVAFDQEVRRCLGEDSLRCVIHSDGELAPEDLQLEVAELLREGGPWGQGFPEPQFDGRFRVVEHRVVGDRHLKLTLIPAGGGEPVDAIAFGQAEHRPESGQELLRLVYRLEVNEFRGRRRLQLLIEHFEVLG
ncbi:MAG: single-stranded-DNA-specific exonuclease RecJ [Gammaproteobacteria bacterium]|nr:single-stranded-DNA-specific exonuclease RecJ [Gammaproteobacteria bacterium]